MKNKTVKKTMTTYSLGNNHQLLVNEEYPDHMCLIEYGEACSGVLKHWGSRKQLVTELKLLVEYLEQPDLLK